MGTVPIIIIIIIIVIIIIIIIMGSKQNIAARGVFVGLGIIHVQI